jgi:hypothetical protein
VIAHGLETREELNTFLCVLQGVYWGLRESIAKFIERFVSEAVFNFEGIGAKEPSVRISIRH